MPSYCGFYSESIFGSLLPYTGFTNYLLYRGLWYKYVRAGTYIYIQCVCIYIFIYLFIRIHDNSVQGPISQGHSVRQVGFAVESMNRFVGCSGFGSKVGSLAWFSLQGPKML